MGCGTSPVSWETQTTLKSSHLQRGVLLREPELAKVHLPSCCRVLCLPFGPGFSEGGDLEHERTGLLLRPKGGWGHRSSPPGCKRGRASGNCLVKLPAGRGPASPPPRWKTAGQRTESVAQRQTRPGMRVGEGAAFSFELQPLNYALSPPCAAQQSGDTPVCSATASLLEHIRRPLNISSPPPHRPGGTFAKCSRALEAEGWGPCRDLSLWVQCKSGMSGEEGVLVSSWEQMPACSCLYLLHIFPVR